MGALYTDEIELLLARLVGCRFTVLGVFSADGVPSAEVLASYSTVTCFVSNTDPARLPGKHWVAFIASRCRLSNKLLLQYFDPYGLPLELYTDLYNSCRERGLLPMLSKCNTLPLQDFASTVCGHYCVLFVHLRASGRSFDVAVRYIRHSVNLSSVERDKFVVRTLHSIMHYRPIKHCLAANFNATRQCCSSRL